MLRLRALTKLARPLLFPCFSTATPPAPTSNNPEDNIVIKTSTNGFNRREYNIAKMLTVMNSNMHLIVNGLKDNSDMITHDMVADIFLNISRGPTMELTDDFWTVIYPYGKKLIRTADRETTNATARVLYSMSKRLIQDDEMWEIAQRKLIKEGLLRYVAISELPMLLYTFTYNEKGKPETIEAIEKLILRNIKHYQRLTDDLVFELLKETYDIMEKEPPELIKELLQEKYNEPVP